VTRAPDWQVYERLIARMMADQLSTEYCVTPNARVVGRISGRSRQIDVLIDLRHDSDNSRRLVVDAKRRRRRVTINDVEAFQGLMEDVGATYGYLVCPRGHTKSAERRAQERVFIRLVPLEHLEGFDPSTWPQCGAPKCSGRVFWDGYPAMTMALRAGGRDGNDFVMSYVHCVGKCDRCGAFKVKCLTCGDMLSPRERDPEDCGHQCRCKTPWFWLASIESDEHGAESAELHVVFASGQPLTVDRRSL
jgi:hypothetical protein